LQGGQMLFYNYVATFIVEFLRSELGKVEISEKGEQVMIKSVDNSMLLSSISIGYINYVVILLVAYF
jgi:hypothetical protein